MSPVIQPSDEPKPLHERLKAVLDGDAVKSRDEARAFISRPGMAPVRPDLPKDEYREKTLGWVKDMISTGFTLLPYDEKYGGTGDGKNYMNVVEVIAHQDLSLAVKQGVQFGLFGLGINNLGTDKHRDALLPEVMSGRLLGGFAMTEIVGGSDVQGIRTEAIYDHATRSFTLNTPDDKARKAFIGNAAVHGEMMVVFAQLKMSPDGESQGVHAFLVPIRDKKGAVLPGVTVEDCGHKAGLNGVDNGYLHFDMIKVPYDAMLDRFASIDPAGAYQSDIPKKSQRFFKMIGTLVTGRVFVSMISLSGAKNALASAVDFAESRQVFGETLLDKQATQSRLFPPLAEAYAMHFASRHLVDELQRGGSQDLETKAAALKARSSDKALSTVDEARKLAGGAGYMSNERYGALRNDIDVFRTFEGDNTVLRLLVAKNQLGRLARKFSDASGIEKIIKGAAMDLKTRLAPFNTGSSKGGTTRLLDTRFQKSVFASRERAMLYGLSKKIQKLAKTHGPAVAANLCQDDMLAYADAYAERLMMEKFIKAVREQKDPEVKAVLKDVCDLFAIHTLRQNALWYVEHGFMSPEKTKSLTRLEHDLQAKIRPHAKTLTEAFGIPPSVLSSAPPAPTPKAPDNKPPAP